MDPVEEIKSKIDVVGLVGEYVPLTHAGRNFRALCPFHKEKTPSFMVSPELGIWRCFGACGEGGDIFKFLMKMENMDFGEAVQVLAKRAGVILTRASQAPSNKQQLYQLNAQAERLYHYLLTKHAIGATALSYLKSERGLRLDTIRQFGLGFAPAKTDVLARFLVDKKGYKKEELLRAGLVMEQGGKLIDRFGDRIMFPLRDHRGNVLGFSGRLLVETTKNLAKYINTPETPVYHKRMHLFGIDVTRDAIREKGSAVIVEGEFDLLSSWQAGVTNVVAIKGSVFTSEQVHLIGRFAQEVVFALDQDAAGDKALRAGLGLVEEAGLRAKVLSTGAFKDPDQAARAQPWEWVRQVTKAQDAYDYLIDQAFARYNHRTTDGVRSISQTVTPILGLIRDSIVRAHYIRLVAQRLSIPETAVAQHLARAVGPVRDAPAGEIEPAKPRRDILEEHLVALSLLYQPDFLLRDEVGLLLTVPLLRRVQEALMVYLNGRQEKFVVAHFVQTLPSELVEGTSALLLDPSLSFEGEEGIALRELNRIVGDLEVLVTQGHIARLTAMIRDKEKHRQSSKGEQEQLAQMIAKLSSLSDKAFSANGKSNKV